MANEHYRCRILSSSVSVDETQQGLVCRTFKSFSQLCSILRQVEVLSFRLHLHLSQPSEVFPLNSTNLGPELKIYAVPVFAHIFTYINAMLSSIIIIFLAWNCLSITHESFQRVGFFK